MSPILVLNMLWQCFKAVFHHLIKKLSPSSSRPPQIWSVLLTSSSNLVRPPCVLLKLGPSSSSSSNVLLGENLKLATMIQINGVNQNICMQRLFIVQSSLVQTSVDQFSLLQSNLVKSRKIFSRLFLAAYSTCRGSLQSSLDQTDEVQFSLVYSSQSKSLTLEKASKIQSNIDKYFLDYFLRYLWLH